MLRIVRVDAHLKAVAQKAAARPGLEFVVGREADERGAFGHAVADRDREADLHEERLGLLVHRGAAHDEDVHLAPERIHQLLADDRMDGRIEQGHLHRDAHRTLFEQRKHLLAVDLLQDHRHTADDRGPHDLHRLDQDLGRGYAPQQGDVAAHGQRRQEVERAAVGVGQRQERQRAAAPLEIARSGAGIDRIAGEEHVAREVVHGEHDAFRVAGGARRVVEQHHSPVLHLGIGDVLGAEAARIGRAEALGQLLHEPDGTVSGPLEDDVEIGQREDRLHLRNALLLDHVPEVVAQEEQAALRMVDDVVHVVGMEVLENGHDDRAVGDRRQVGDAPPGIVAADQRDAVARHDAQFAEKQMQTGDFGRRTAVGEGLLLEIVGQRRQIEIRAEAGGIEPYEVVVQHAVRVLDVITVFRPPDPVRRPSHGHSADARCISSTRFRPSGGRCSCGG